MAVLFRAVYHSAELQLELAKRNIPFVVRGGLRYFEQAHIKDVVAYLKILLNVKDEIAWKRILRLQDGIGPTSADKLWLEISKFSDLAELAHHEIDLRGNKAINSWNKIISAFRYLAELDFTKRGTVAEAVIYLLEGGYREYLKTTFENYRERMDDLHQFTDFVMTYDNLEKLLSDVLLSESFGRNSQAADNAVVLSTIHQAKGLEWKFVFVIGLRDGDFPHYKSMEQESELEEERRLFYVAATRAKDELYLLYPIRKNSFQYGDLTGGPSMFIRELAENKYSTLKLAAPFQPKENNGFYDDEVVELDF